jgi:phosphate transporter
LTLTDLYVNLTDLVAFLDMNRTGFRKIMKKHDKVTSSALLTLYMPRVNEKLSEARQDEVESVRPHIHTIGHLCACF